MLWLLMFFLLVVAISPLMMMRQSPRQRRHSALRSAALGRGVKVSLVARPDGRASGSRGHGGQQYARYWLALEKPQQAAGAVLHRIDDNGWESAYPGWVWRDKASDRRRDPVLAELIAQLPVGVLALSWDGGSVGAIWDERGELDDIGALCDRLTALKAWRERLISAKT